MVDSLAYILGTLIAFAINFLMCMLQGAMWAVLITPVVSQFAKSYYELVIRQNYIYQANNDGRIAEGKKVESQTGNQKKIFGVRIDDGVNIGVYQYTVNGTEYRYTYRTDGDLPETLTLYYSHNPKYARAREYFRSLGKTGFRRFMNVTLVISVILFALSIGKT